MIEKADQETIQNLEKIILCHRDYIFKPPKNTSVIFMMSGGLDSTIGAARAIEEWGCVVYPLFIRRHARATKYEEGSFDRVANTYRLRYPNNFMPSKKVDVEVPPLEFKSGLTELRLKKLGHALRNACLQALGVQYAAWLNDNRNLGIKTVLAANVGDDFLPHSSIQAYRTFTILTCTDQNDWGWQISSLFTDPYLEGRPIYKKDNIKWAIERNLPLAFTRTCINDCEVADGTCGECQDRLKAFEEAGVKDPITYQTKL